MPRRKPPQITTDTPIGADVDLEREDIRLADGTRLTEEVAARIAQETLRSVGRPSLSGARHRSPQIAFRVPPAVRDQAAEVAAREGKTVSELAREALEERIAASRRAS
jgi:predicted HicB family RNase H-like nuclease